MEGVDITACTVYLWFLSALPVISNIAQLRASLNAKGDEEIVIDGGIGYSVLTLSITTCSFCLLGVRIIRPRVFSGENHSASLKS